ncbi:hypothetical protein [Bradyrhizobium septentrionale]|uniref:Uncharacterized protein n=1 Tax=Bradyrhizobium septentrionale TaxID=1404411 RepID=A0ABZ2P4H5_9BRAD
MTKPIPDLDDAANFMVGVGVRIVPAGVENGFVRASLILSPVAAASAAAACGKKVDIRQWPQRIEAMLQAADEDKPGNLEVALCPVKAGEALASPADDSTTFVRAFRAMFHEQPAKGRINDYATWVTAQRDKDVDEVTTMWERLIAPPKHEDWRTIVDALKQAGVGAQLGPLRSKPTPAAATTATTPPAPTPPGPPDIRGVGRGQAALLLSLERGRSLLARANLDLNRSGCADREDECNLAAPKVIRRTSYLTRAVREEAAAKGPKELQEAEDQALQKYEEMSQEDRKKRERDLLEDDMAPRNTEAKKAQAQLKEIHDKITGAATPREQRVAAYANLLKCATSLGVNQCFAAVTDASKEALAKAIDDSIGRHKDSVYEEDVVGREDPKRPNDLEKAYNKQQAARAPQTRLAGLQTQPSLARLFNFVVDILIPFDLFQGAAQSAKPFPERHGVGTVSQFGFLSAALVCRDSARRVWTTCKIRLVENNVTEKDDVWACTRNELDLFATLSGSPSDISVRDGLIANGALSQIDGVVHIAATRKTGETSKPEPRFDIISLDSAQAVENRQTVQVGSRPGTTPLVTLRTAGLALVDRWRETSALMQALSSIARNDNPAIQVVDADDLTVGYRLDVAVKSDKGTLEWRSLCNRWVKFGDSKNHVESLLARVIPDPERRLAFDSAIVVMAAKIQPGSGSQTATAHVDDTIAHWTGPPIGVDANSHDIDLSDNKLALQLGHCYSLSPDPDRLDQMPDGLKIPRQIFGGGYHFGLSPRLLGGVIRPFDGGRPYRPVTPKDPEVKLTDAEKNFAVLPSPTVGPRRFLRHERIEAPIVTTPLPILKRTFDKVVDGLRESADTIVVRSRPSEKGSDVFVPFDRTAEGKEIATSYRVVVPPSVSAEFADRHGVFDDSKALATFRDSGKWPWKGPPDGLADVSYDEPAGGFPVFGYSRSSQGGLEAQSAPLGKPTGDAVFRPRTATSERRDPYYPDPAAHYIVIALRDLAGRLLPGEPLVVPVRPADPGKAMAYPNVRPVAIEVVAIHKRTDRPASHGRILGLHTNRNDQYLRGAEVIAKPSMLGKVLLDGGDTIVSGKVEASRVRVALEPGESFEIDMWCVPADERQLARWFDAVESAALVASVDPATGQTCISCESFEQQLKKLKMDQLTDFVTRLGLSRAAANATICGPAQAKMPAGALRCIAELAYKMLLKHPTPELAARTTIVATHAIAQPLAAPKAQLQLSRVTAQTAATPAGADLAKQAVAVSGTVTVDRPTTGFFEVRAQGASLVSNAFDDEQRRRRTSDEVARGIWPRSPVTEDLMSVRDVYGFEVAADGVVKLASEQATLLRVDDDIAPPEPGATGMEDRDIGELQKDSKSPANAGNVVRVASPFTISDSRARILTMWAIAGSRNAACFRDEKGDISSDPATEMALPPQMQTVVLQATKAPAKVAALTILPAFSLQPGYRVEKTLHKFVVERKIRLRIRLRRPWFSSGEGERLGIVLWPPDIFKGRIAYSESSVARDYDVSRNEKADIDMKQFRDEDLGPGGGFVTRWGLDPIKGGGELGWLTPPAAFADLDKPHIDLGAGDVVLPPGAVYVPRASVPIPVEDGTGQRLQARLEAALLTFVPKFDLDHESWFCDVELRSGTAPEPFMRMGLVRYQPYAPAPLRVSEPIVEWLQIPQQRTVTVTLDPANPKLLKVSVAGTGAIHSASAPSGYDTGRIESWTQRPAMKITVLRRTTNGVDEVAELDKNSAGCVAGYSDRAEYVWMPRNQAEWEQALTVSNDSGKSRPRLAVRPDHPGPDSPLSWVTEFQLSENPLKPATAGTSYSVLVEEVQPMLPATYADEPIDSSVPAPKDREELTFSGPRFAALVELKLARPEPSVPAAPRPKAVTRAFSSIVKKRKRAKAPPKRIATTTGA